MRDGQSAKAQGLQPLGFTLALIRHSILRNRYSLTFMVADQSSRHTPCAVHPKPAVLCVVTALLLSHNLSRDAMWCRHCQQDVPALARGANGPLVCPQCECDLPPFTAKQGSSKKVTANQGTTSGDMLSDAGIALDSYDEKNSESPPRLDVFDQDELRQQLQRIGRKLGPTRGKKGARSHLCAAPSGPFRQMAPDPFFPRIDWTHRPTALPELSDADLAAVSYHSSQEPSRSAKTPGAWLVSLLLMCGLAGIAGGIGLLAWSATTRFAPAWQWGMTTTIASQGILIAGLVWMATRLWRNSRRVNRQLQGIDRQLGEIQYQTSFGSDRRATSSGPYYDHFARGASSQMLLANLRWQLEQLSARIMSR